MSLAFQATLEISEQLGMADLFSVEDVLYCMVKMCHSIIYQLTDFLDSM